MCDVRAVSFRPFISSAVQHLAPLFLTNKVRLGWILYVQMSSCSPYDANLARCKLARERMSIYAEEDGDSFGT